MQIHSPDWPHRGAFYVYASRNILCTVIDLIRPMSRRPKFDLRLMSWGNGTGVPASGKKLVIAGIDDNDLLHIRIFDQDGHKVTDTDEARLPAAQAQAILMLRQRVPGLLPPHVMTDAERSQTLREVTSIVGQTWRPAGPLCPDEPAPVNGLSVDDLLTLQQALVDLGRALSEDHRAVVELRFLGECTLDEVAELLSISSRYKVLGMSKVALEFLRERLEPSFPEFG
jgi:hypothetical protein